MNKNDVVRKRLLEAYNTHEVATWTIYGEDPNCDLGGSHHEPLLETVTGTYCNVVDYALELAGFFQWGSGGRIVKQPSAVKNVDKLNSPHVKRLEREREQLMKQVEDINTAIKEATK